MEDTLSNEQPKTLLSRFDFGIASVVIAAIAGISLFVIIIAASITMETSTPGGIPEESPILMIAGILAILVLFGGMVGAGLGIAGLLRENKKKTWSILGLILNVSIILLLVWLIIL